MPVLNDKAVFDSVRDGKLGVSPLIPNNVQPASLDLTLYHEIEVFEPTGELSFELSAEDLQGMERIADISEGYRLMPGQYVTGRSAEFLELPQNILGILTNRNSLAKAGLNAAVSAFATPGFKGRKTIVIQNMGRVPFIIKAGMRICQISFFALSGESLRSYEGRHDEALLSTYSKADFPHVAEVGENIDNPYSAALHESIRRLAKERVHATRRG